MNGLDKSSERLAKWLMKYVEKERGAVVSLKPGRAAEGAGIPLRHVAYFLRHLHNMGLVEKFNRNTYIFARSRTNEIIEALKKAVAAV